MREIDGERRRWETGLQEKEKLEAVGPIVESNFVLSLMIQNENRQDSELCRRLLEIGEAYGAIMVLEYRERALPDNGPARPDGRKMAPDHQEPFL